MLKVLLLFSTSGLVLFGPSMRAPNGESTPLALTAPFEAVSSCSDCAWCTGGHTANAGTDMRGIHTWCMSLAHCNGHPSCGSGGGGTQPGEGCGEEEPDCDGGGEVPLPEPQAVSVEHIADQAHRSAAASIAFRAFDGDAAALDRLVTEFRSLVHYDWARSVVRLEGCTPQTVAALIPLSVEDWTRLAGPNPE